MSLSEPDWQRLAAELVVHFHKSPPFVARIFSCPVTVVRDCVAASLKRQTQDETAMVASPFVSVVLEDSDTIDQTVCEPIPLEIVTSNGLTLRLQVSSLYEVIELLQSLEAER